jgi:hypothetical protein
LLSYEDQVPVNPSVPAHGASSGWGVAMPMSVGVMMIWLMPYAQRTMRRPLPSSPSPGILPIQPA